MTVVEQERNGAAGSMDTADFVPLHAIESVSFADDSGKVHTEKVNGRTSSRPPIRLNLGSGDILLSGYDNIDRKNGREVYPLKFDDNSVSEVRASHVLEHFSHRQVADVIREWVRVLKPGGILKIAVPDFEWIAREYLAGKPINVQGYVMGGHVDANDHHGAIFDREELPRVMRKLGLYDVRPWKSEIKDCASLEVSLNFQGKKKGPLPKLKIAGAMSIPRLGFMDNFFTWTEALLPLGIRPRAYTGAFWGQCLERIMSDQLEADYILTIDYDSVFDRENVEHLIRLADEHPEADAIAPIELMRGGETILSTILGEDGKPTNRIAFDVLESAELVQANTAHFGMTLLKTEALKKMAHPWFMGIPNNEGKWEKGKLDDDTYFWKKWRETGNSLYLASHVVIAHGQFMLSWPGRNMEPIYQNPADFRDSGMPEGVWR